MFGSLSCGISVCSVSLPLLCLVSAVTVSSGSMSAVVGVSLALEDWLSDVIVVSRFSSVCLFGRQCRKCSACAC